MGCWKADTTPAKMKFNDFLNVSGVQSEVLNTQLAMQYSLHVECLFNPRTYQG